MRIGIGLYFVVPMQQVKLLYRFAERIMDENTIILLFCSTLMFLPYSVLAVGTNRNEAFMINYINRKCMKLFLAQVFIVVVS